MEGILKWTQQNKTKGGTCNTEKRDMKRQRRLKEQQSS